MDFIQNIETPSSTPETAPLKTTVQLTRGKLVGGWIYYPAAAAGLLHFIARRGITQVSPWNTGQSIALAGVVAPLSFGFELSEPPFTIDCWTWNTSADAALSLVVCFTLAPIGKRPWPFETVENPFKGTNGYKKP